MDWEKCNNSIILFFFAVEKKSVYKMDLHLCCVFKYFSFQKGPPVLQLKHKIMFSVHSVCIYVPHETD